MKSCSRPPGGDTEARKLAHLRYVIGVKIGLIQAVLLLQNV